MDDSRIYSSPDSAISSTFDDCNWQAGKSFSVDECFLQDPTDLDFPDSFCLEMARFQAPLKNHAVSSMVYFDPTVPCLKREIDSNDNSPTSQQSGIFNPVQEHQVQSGTKRRLCFEAVNSPKRICLDTTLWQPAPTKQFSQSVTIGPALNTNGKPRAKRGSATDPQSVYARHRRERINERLKMLQHLVPNGAKVDIVTMLEEAIHYVKFLQLQVNLLSSDEYWIYAPMTYNGPDTPLGVQLPLMA